MKTKINLFRKQLVAKATNRSFNAYSMKVKDKKSGQVCWVEVRLTKDAGRKDNLITSNKGVLECEIDMPKFLKPFTNAEGKTIYPKAWIKDIISFTPSASNLDVDFMVEEPTTASLELENPFKE